MKVNTEVNQKIQSPAHFLTSKKDSDSFIIKYQNITQIMHIKKSLIKL